MKILEIPDILLTEHITPEFVRNVNQYLKHKNELPYDEIVWFFQILHELSDTEYHKLVRFICGTDVLPIDNLKFAADANCLFKIILYKHSNSLPTSLTCLRTLTIYEYTSKEQEKEALLKAINECDTLLLF